MNAILEHKTSLSDLPEQTSDLQIYVACLAAYNNGKLHGAWIDADRDADEIMDDIQIILESSPEHSAAYPCEEWAIHDYSGFGNLSLGEYMGAEKVSAIACFIADADDTDLAIAVLDHACGDLEQAQKWLTEDYHGCYSSLGDYAAEMCEGMGDIPGWLENYVDYAAMGRDMELGGDIFTIETGYNEIHVFSNC